LTKRGPCGIFPDRQVQPTTTEVAKMAPDEQEGAANQQEPAVAEVEKKEAEKPKLGNLGAVEKVVNEYARKFATKHRVKESEFVIVLSEQLHGIWGVRRGPVTQIILLWPNAQLNINTILDDVFRLIAKRHLVDTMAVESSMLIKRRAEDRRKLVRKQIGNDEADIILDLIPKHRIVTTRTTTVEYRDLTTGETYAVTHKEKPEPYRGQDVSNWLKLSRIVRDRHAEEATRYDVEVIAPEASAGDDA
jgi:hypothetical protein